MKVKFKNFIFFILVFALCFSSINVYATNDELYFSYMEQSEIIPYTYENSSVQSNIQTLINDTENLKTNYSSSEALRILSSLRDNVDNVTKNDYINNYNLKTDEDNYETGECYKYKNSPVQWIMKNVIHAISKNSNNDFDTIKEMCDIIFEIGQTEMQNGCVTYEAMIVVSQLRYIEDRFVGEIKDYINYVYNIASQDCLGYDSGIVPETIVPSEYKPIYDEEQRKNDPEPPESGTPVDDTEIIIDVPPLTEDEFFTGNGFNIDNSNGGGQAIDNTGVNDFSSYFDTMNQIQNSSISNKKNESFEIRSIYYTLDKTATNVEWTDIGINIIDEETIPYGYVTKLLNTIQKFSDDFYFIEDSDMCMFIAEGKVLVLNNIENVPVDEFDTLFDDFEKLGVKVMLKSDEDNKVEDSLTSKVEAGEVNTISINGNNLILTDKPILSKNILQLPVSQTAKALGYNVSINGKTVTLVYDMAPEVTETTETTETTEQEVVSNKVEVVLTVGSTKYTVNGQTHTLKTPMVEKNGVIYVEFDNIASEIGYDYFYNADENVLTFNK